MLNVKHFGCKTKNVNKNTHISIYRTAWAASHSISPCSTQLALQRGGLCLVRKPGVTQLCVSQLAPTPTAFHLFEDVIPFHIRVQLFVCGEDISTFLPHCKLLRYKVGTF